MRFHNYWLQIQTFLGGVTVEEAWQMWLTLSEQDRVSQWLI